MNTEKFNQNDAPEPQLLVNKLPLKDEEQGPLDGSPSPKRSKVGRIALGVVLAVGLVGGGVAYAVNSSKPAEEPTKPAIVQKKDEQVKQSIVKLTIEAEGADVAAGATKAKITATDKDGKEALKEFEVEANKEVEVGKLDSGTYELHVTCAPVLADGATYKLPETPQKFEVNKDGKTTVLKVKLEVIAKADMTKEQLEAAASVLVENGNTDAANHVVEAAKSAPSVEGSANAIQRPAAPSNNNGGNSGGSSGNAPSAPSGGNSGGNTPSPAPAPAPAPTPTPEPPKPQHSHSWNPQYTTVNVPAVYENQWVSNWVYVPQYTCGTCGVSFSTPQAAAQHQYDNTWNDNPCGAYCTSGYKVDQGSYQSVLITPASSYQQISGYSCSCGATK